LRVIDWFGDYLSVRFNIDQALVGGASIDQHGQPVIDDVVTKALAADAVIFGAVGGEKWDHLPRADRPEMGILRLRKDLDLFANLRPALNFPEIAGSSSLRPELVDSCDIMIVRESTSGIYFGKPRGITIDDNGLRHAVDTQSYDESEIARVCRTAFDIARGRNRRLCSVDKANVMETGVLWRTVVTEVSADFPDVELSHMYADNCAMQLLREPRQFDVIVTDNLFGDILSDEAAALCGSLGMLPSATVHMNDTGQPVRALYEPIHGSAPDIAGRGMANPLASILSFGMCLHFSLQAPAAAAMLYHAVRRTLSEGNRTADIVAAGEEPVSGTVLTDAIIAALESQSSGERRVSSL